MRENIGLYHGKRLDNGEWVVGFYLNHKNVVHYIVATRHGGYEDMSGELHVPEWYEVDPDTVGECTGVRDNSGKCAFEHHITEDNWGRRWVIFGCEGGFGIRRISEWNRNDPIYNALSDAQNASWFKENHIIIGNIHDNPDLLDGGVVHEN